MPGDYDFRRDAHAYIVTSDGTVESVFCRGFVSGTCAGNIYSPLQFHALAFRYPEHLVLQGEVVCAGHVGESRSELVEVRAYQRVGEQVDMVPDKHQVADGVALVVVDADVDGNIVAGAAVQQNLFDAGVSVNGDGIASRLTAVDKAAKGAGQGHVAVGNGGAP